MKRYLPFVIVAAVALVTLGSGAMLYRAKRPQVLSMPENRSLGGKSGTESMHIRGNPDAPATLEEFADFQCPPCSNFAGFAEELLKQYDSRLRIVFRNFPLPGHERCSAGGKIADLTEVPANHTNPRELMTEIIYKGESYTIIGACFEVYNEKGCGFLEPVYQECLGIEFEYQRIPAIAKPSLGLSYRGRTLKQIYEQITSASAKLSSN